MLELDLTGKTALITGATGQLGRVMAHTLADCGADIAVHYHANRLQADKLVAERPGWDVGHWRCRRM